MRRLQMRGQLLGYNKAMLPGLDRIEFEETPEWLKIVLPVRRNWILFVLFTILLVVWMVMLVMGIVFMVRDVAMSGESFAFVFTVMLLALLFILFRFGRVLWGQWQYYTANREILFVNKDQLIVRRPVSILGITDAYDMNHVSPFYYNEKHQCPTFNYAFQHVYFGRDLERDEAQKLITFLNERYFPNHDDDN